MNQKTSKLVLCTAILFLLGSKGNWADDTNNPCTESGSYSACTWECLSPGSISGARLDPPTSTNFVICKGESISVPNILADLGDGTKECNNGVNTLVCTNSANYGRDPNLGTTSVTYSLSKWWEPEIPDTFDTPGTFTFTAKAKGVDGPCSDTSEVEAGQVKVTVVGISVNGPTKVGAGKNILLTAVGIPRGGEYTWTAAGYPLEIVGASDQQSVTLFTGCLDFDVDTSIMANYEYESALCSTDVDIRICVPSDEVTEGEWVSGFSMTGKFRAELLPSDVDFSGCSVREKDPGGASDSCWFDGSAIDPNTDGITGGSWGVGEGNLWCCDIVQMWDSDAVQYYRNNPAGSPRAPCNARWPQDMELVCRSGGIKYTANILEGEIGIATVSVSRDRAVLSKAYP